MVPKMVGLVCTFEKFNRYESGLNYTINIYRNLYPNLNWTFNEISVYTYKEALHINSDRLLAKYTFQCSHLYLRLTWLLVIQK